jgi:tetratricopeptide (TPR) repeat protein
MRWPVMHGFAPNNPALHLTGMQFVLTVPVLTAEYLWKALVPVDLNAWYTFHPVSSLSWRPLLAIAAIALLVWAMFRVRRSHGLLSFSLAWFFLTLIPVLDIPKLGDNVLTERYLYIPTFGFSIVAAWGWLWMTRHMRQPLTERVVYAAAAAVALLCSSVVLRRIPIWHDSATLWEQTARQDPDDPVVVNAAGTALYRDGELAPALAQFERAVELAPDQGYTHNSLGGAYFAFHRYDEALGEFQKAVALSSDPMYWRNLGVAYANKKIWPNAIAAFERALDQFERPAVPVLTADARATLMSLYIQYGTALLKGGQVGRAIDAFEHAVQLDPGNFDARLRLGNALLEQGQAEAARTQIASALEASPGSPQAYLAHYDLGRIYRQQGLQEAANLEMQEALRLNPMIGNSAAGVSPLQLVAPEKQRTALRSE